MMQQVISLAKRPHVVDYIHRVGRTARAGRSGLAISFVNKLVLERFGLIEQHIGKKLTRYPVEKAVLLWHERVSDAKRMSHMTINNSTAIRKRRRVEDDDDEAEIFATMRKSTKATKKSKRLRRLRRAS